MSNKRKRSIGILLTIAMLLTSLPGFGPLQVKASNLSGKGVTKQSIAKVATVGNTASAGEPVAYFDFNESDTTNKASNPQLTGSIAGTGITVYSDEGVSGGSLKFENATSPGFKIPDAVNMKSEDLTISAFLKFDSYYNAGVKTNIFQQDGTGRTLLYLNPSKQYVSYVNGSDTVLGEAVRVENWHLVTLTWSASQNDMKLYINDKLHGEGTMASGITDAKTALLLGTHKNNNDGTYKGLADEYRIYKKALSEAEVKALYDSYRDSEALQVNKEALKKLIQDTEAEGYKKEDYNVRSWSDYEAALQAAKEFLGNEDEYTQADVDHAVDALRTAINRLSRIPVYEEQLEYTEGYILYTGKTVSAGDVFAIYSNNGNVATNNRILHSDGNEKTDKVTGSTSNDGNVLNMVSQNNITYSEQLWEVVSVAGDSFALKNIDEEVTIAGNYYLDLTKESNDNIYLSTQPVPLTITAVEGKKGVFKIEAASDNGFGLAYESTSFKAKSEASEIRLYTRGKIYPTIQEPNPPTGTTQGQPFAANTGGSGNFRIPAIITLSDGTLIAAADARWNHQGDACSIDIMVSRSTDNGANWNYSLPAFFNDSTNAKHTYGACFIDPVLVRDAKDKIYMMVDLYPGGIAINTAPKSPHAASGYEEIKGEKRLVLYTTPDPDLQTDDNYTYYVGDYGLDGLAPVYEVIGDNDYSEDASFYMDESFYLYTKEKEKMYCKQLGDDSVMVHQNVFFYNALLHVRCATYLYLITSEDKGETWSKPMLLNSQIRKEENPDIFYGVGPGAGLCLEDGTIMLPCYTFRNQYASFVYSTDEGKTWKRSDNATQSDWSSESALIQLDSTTVRHFYRDGHNSVRYTDHILENGRWVAGTPVTIQDSNVVKRNNCQISVIRYSKTIDGKPVVLLSTAAKNDNRQDGKIYAFTVDMEAQGKPMTLVGTYDNNPDTNTDYYAYSSLTELTDGTIGLLYESQGAVITYKNITPEQFTPALVFDVDEAEKPQVKLTIEGNLDKYYDGESIDVNKISIHADRELYGFTIRFYKDVNCTIELEEAPVDAGQYWLKFTVSETDEYAASESNELGFVINRAEIDATSAEGELHIKNGGNEVVITKVGFDGLVGEEALILGEDYEVVTVDSNVISDTQAEVTFNILLKDTQKASNYLVKNMQVTRNVAITGRISEDFVISGELSKEYDGMPVDTELIKVDQGNLDGMWTLQFYELVEGEKIDLLDQVPKDVGLYGVVAVMATEGTGEANPIMSNALEFSISKAPLKITEAEAVVTVSENQTDIGVTHIGFKGLKNNEVLVQNVDYKVKAALSGEIGETTANVMITVSLNETERADNYIIEDNMIETQAAVRKEGDNTEPGVSDNDPGVSDNDPEILGYENIWVDGLEDKVYTGSKITQNLKVYDGDKLLLEGSDYTISYKNNVNACEFTDEELAAFEEAYRNDPKTKANIGNIPSKKAPQVVLEMKGNYTGTRSLFFRIEKQDISDGDNFIIDDLTITNTGKNKVPVPVVTWKYNGKNLKNKKDFTVEQSKEGAADILIVRGNGNFKGEKIIDYIVTPDKNTIAMNQVKVSKIQPVDYKDGESLKPSGFTVKYKKATLTEGTHFEVSAVSANDIMGNGMATMVLTAKEGAAEAGYSFVGSKRVSFKVNTYAMNKVKASGLVPQTFTGDAINILDDKDSNGNPVVSLTIPATKTTSARTLTAEDYTVTYEKNVAKGTASVTLTGIPERGVTGSKKLTFKINPTTLSKEEGSGFEVTLASDVSGNDAIVYHTKGGAKPAVIIVREDGQTLVEGRDYTVTYKSNKGPGQGQAVVKGKGNYTGQFNLSYTIEKKPVSEADSNGVWIQVNDKVHNTKKNSWKQNFKVLDSDGKALANKKDADIKGAVYTIIGLPANAPDNIHVGDVLSDAGTVLPEGSEVQITVTLAGSYEGKVTGTYRIIHKDRDISKAKFQLNPQQYTGEAVIIDSNDDFKKRDLKGTAISMEEGEGQIFEVVEGSYSNNLKKGTAKVTLRGVGEYGGIKTVTFKIGARSITDWFDSEFRYW